ncbi:MAG TPA: alcohol dehydrogenase catalytic domain-containing protein [Acidiferrobacterales bacterium]|nr:alcohol dehydrogenase catalytic domain-containing protein [Acidiferrobacterales bacterium]
MRGSIRDYKLLEQLTATSKYPFVMGIDFAGVVERVSTGERDLHIGDRVFGMARRLDLFQMA